MKIQSINSLYLPKMNFLNNSSSILSAKNIQQDCFVPSFSSRQQELADYVIYFQPKMDAKYYSSLASREKIAVNITNTDPNIKKAAKETVKVANLLKKNLDKKYGKDNYVFVSIGTSPACIGRVMEFSGVETKYLPITDLRDDRATIPNIAKNKEGVKAYKDFLTSQGITKERLENPDKHIIFYDYTNKGTSLRKYKYMLKEVFDLPTNNDKVEFRSINKDFAQILTDSIFADMKLVSDYIGDYIGDYMAGEYSYVYAGIPHLEYNKLEQINDILKEKEYRPYEDLISSSDADKNKYRKTETERRFSLFVMQELEKRGKLKHNPKNEKAL